MLLDLKSYSILRAKYSLDQGTAPCIDYHIEEVSSPPKRNDKGWMGTGCSWCWVTLDYSIIREAWCLPALVTDMSELTMHFWSLSGIKELRSSRVTLEWQEEHCVHSEFLDTWRGVRWFWPHVPLAGAFAGLQDWYYTVPPWPLGHRR